MSDYTLGDVIYHKFTTRAFATGVPTALAGSPTLEIYENDSATPIVEGASKLVLTQNLNSINGYNLATITATGANGFEAGKSYSLMLKTGTVGGTSVVGEAIWEFTLNASAAFTRLGAPAGASVSADVAAVKTDTTAILVDTGSTLDDLVDDLESRLGTPSDLGSGATIAANLADIEAQTDDIGAAGAGLTALASATNLATVAGYLDTEIGLILEDTGTTIPGLIGALNNLSGADAATAVWAKALLTGFSADRILRIIAAVAAGKISGGPGSPVFRDLLDLINMVTGTADSDGNRTSATYGA